MKHTQDCLHSLKWHRVRRLAVKWIGPTHLFTWGILYLIFLIENMLKAARKHN